jgi:hypothetical protein
VKLKRKQQNALLEWAAEGLRLPEINERAAEFDPPFEASYLQLKHARTRAKKRFSELREDFEKEALSEGLSRKAVRIRRLAQLAEKIEADLLDRDRLWVQEPKQVGAQVIEVERFNAAEVKEYRGLPDDIARELGERRQSIDLALTKELDALLDRLRDNLDADTYAKVLALAAGVETSGGRAGHGQQGDQGVQLCRAGQQRQRQDDQRIMEQGLQRGAEAVPAREAQRPGRFGL